MEAQTPDWFWFSAGSESPEKIMWRIWCKGGKIHQISSLSYLESISYYVEWVLEMKTNASNWLC